MKQMAVISGTANTALAQDIVQELNIINPKTPVSLIDACIKHFRDGEVYCSIEETVRGSDVFIIQPTSAPANDNLMELLLIVDAAKRASAGSVTAVMPYFGYARQDRKVARRDPISARLVANILESAGVDRVLTLDLHAKQIQGFFNIPVDNLSGITYFAHYWQGRHIDSEQTIAVSPDVGGVVRTRQFAAKLGLSGIAIVDKNRSKANECEVMNIIGDVSGKHCILCDDIIDTAGTLCKAAKALVEHGAVDVYACASHGVLSDGAEERIFDTRELKEVHLLDTIHKSLLSTRKIQYHSCAVMFAEAMKNIFCDTSFDSVGL